MREELGPNAQDLKNEHRGSRGDCRSVARGRQIIAIKSGHHVQRDEPQPVVESSQQLLSAPRKWPPVAVSPIREHLGCGNFDEFRACDGRGASPAQTLRFTKIQIPSRTSCTSRGSEWSCRGPSRIVPAGEQRPGWKSNCRHGVTTAPRRLWLWTADHGEVRVSMGRAAGDCDDTIAARHSR